MASITVGYYHESAEEKNTEGISREEGGEMSCVIESSYSHRSRKTVFGSSVDQLTGLVKIGVFVDLHLTDDDQIN